MYAGRKNAARALCGDLGINKQSKAPCGGALRRAAYAGIEGVDTHRVWIALRAQASRCGRTSIVDAARAVRWGVVGLKGTAGRRAPCAVSFYGRGCDALRVQRGTGWEEEYSARCGASWDFLFF